MVIYLIELGAENSVRDIFEDKDYCSDRCRRRLTLAEVLVQFLIEPLPEGAYLVTSDKVPGFIEQGCTVTKATKSAQDVVRRLVDSYRDQGDPLPSSLQRVFSGPYESSEIIGIAA